jgi:hypothetical protein
LHSHSSQPRVKAGIQKLLLIISHLFFDPLLAFIVQIILATVSVILVLSHKFAKPEDQRKWCGLQDEDENAWGFGQTLSVIMLMLLGKSAARTYLEGRYEIRGTQ